MQWVGPNRHDFTNFFHFCKRIHNFYESNIIKVIIFSNLHRWVKREIKSSVKLFHLISYNYIYLLMLESTMGWNPSEEAIFFTIFSRSLKKTCHQRKLRQTKCLLFNSWGTKLTKTPILPNCQVPHGFFFGVQVNFCQKLLFLHQLTHNMTTDCSLNYKFNTWKFHAQTWGEHVVYKNCFECQKPFLYKTSVPQVSAWNFHVLNL